MIAASEGNSCTSLVDACVAARVRHRETRGLHRPRQQAAAACVQDSIGDKLRPGGATSSTCPPAPGARFFKEYE